MTNENKLTIRKLTERECMMLQGFTREETDRLMDAKTEDGRRKYPKTAIYKFAGNAVCVECFKRITEQILDDIEHPEKAKRGTLEAWL